MRFHSSMRALLPGTTRAQLHCWKFETSPDVTKSTGVSEYLFDRWRASPADTSVVTEKPNSVDPLIWHYELLRLFCCEFNKLLVCIKAEGVCSVETCPKMTATDEWHFLCAAHRKPQDCPAIDYMRHTVDGSVALLLSLRNFPNRTAIPQSNGKIFLSMLRRLYRIFSHLFYHHVEFFERYESEYFFCTKFTAFVRHFSLVPEDTLIIPSSAMPNLPDIQLRSPQLEEPVTPDQ